MPMFSMPDMPTQMTMLDHMTKRTKAMMPAEFASAVNLMAHPIAASAAMSAIGAGMAGHAMGIWFGTMSGAAAASRRAFLQFAEAGAPDVDAFRDALRTPALRATEAATALIAEVGSVAKVPARARNPRVRTSVPQPEANAPDTEAKSPDTESAPDSLAGAPVAVVPPVEAVADVIEAAPSVEAPVPFADPVAPVETTVEVTQADAAPAVAEQTAAIVAEAVEAAPRQPASIDRPEQPDDLKAISGVGPKLEQVLNGIGIWSYAQIAGLDVAETAWLDDALGFRGRIGRDDWIGQAAKLAADKG